MGEGEVEVLGAQGGPGDAFDLLQHPGPDVSISRGARADRLPGPAELYVWQVHIDADQVQARGERRQRRPGYDLTEHQGRQDQDRRPLELARDTAPRTGPAAIALRRQRPGREEPGIAVIRIPQVLRPLPAAKRIIRSQRG